MSNFWNQLLISQNSAQMASVVVARLQKLSANRFSFGLLMALVAVVVIFISPVVAQPTQITPTSPQLGDTLSVVFQTDSPAGGEAPSVVMDGTTYPAYSLGGDRYRALLPTTPLDNPGRKTIQVKAGTQVQNLAVQLSDRNFPTQSIWLPPDQADLEGTDYEFDRVDAFKALKTPEKYWNGAFQRPSAGEITTIYGVRRYYNGKFANDYYHRGVDYAAGYGAAVMAPAAGRVALVGREADGFEIHGNCIGIDHGQGVASIFLHLSRINVQEGDLVQAGQVIGAEGDTGIATGPHLHWGLYVHGQSVDPVPWRYEGIN